MFGDTLNVKDYGAKGNGMTDDTKAIQSAIDAFSPLIKGTIYFPAGVYIIASFATTANYLENYSLLMHSNLHFKGDGDKTVIRVASHIFDKTDSSANAHLFYGRKINNIIFSNLLIDLNGGNNLVPPNTIKNHSAIFTAHGHNYYIHDITIKNCSGTNMLNIMGDGSSLIIKNCNFLNGGNYVGTIVANKNQIDFSFIYSEWDSTVVNNNLIRQQNIDIALGNYTGGIELHGSNSSATNNVIEGCWPGIYVTSSKNPVLKNVSIQKNEILNCITGISFWLINPMENIVIGSNKISLTVSRVSRNNLCTGIMIPNGNAKEYDNKFANAAPINNLQIKDNTILADSMPMLTAGMILHSLQNSCIIGNTIIGMNYGGMVFTGSKWGMSSVVIKNNNFKDFMPNYNKNTASGYIVITDTYSKNVKQAPGFKKITFSSNKFLRKKKSINPSANFSGAFIEVPENNVSEIEFKNNQYSIPSERIHIVKSN